MKLNRSIICSCMLSIMLLSSGVFAFAGGDGTSGNPYQITTPAELNDVRNYLGVGIYFKLMNDVDISGYSNWTPIGRVGGEALYFKGRFNGTNHTITGLRINSPTGQNLGLFGYLSDSAVVQNLAVCNGDVTGQFYIGILAGYNSGVISNCVSNGVVTGIEDRWVGSGNAGVLVGANGGTINNCCASGNISVSMLVSTGWPCQSVGGLAGYNGGTITTSYSTVGISGNVSVGGLVGYNNNSGTISNCAATGSVLGKEGVGGLVGIAGGNSSIIKCYSTGVVWGNTSFGGLLGFLGTSSSATDCYWDLLTSAITTSAAGTGKTTSELKQQATFSNWDFTTTPIWKMTEGSTYPYQTNWCNNHLSVSVAPAASGVLVGQNSPLYYLGSLLSLTAVSYPGYSFVNWTKNGTAISTSTNLSFLIIPDSLSIVANFIEDLSAVATFKIPASFGVFYTTSSGTIKYTLPKSALVSLRIFSMNGKQISMAMNEFQNPGIYTINVSRNNKISAGTYLMVFKAGEYQAQKKISVWK
jgi:hypothetical protein